MYGRHGGHEWDDWGYSRCVRCECRREDYEDNIRPFCSPVHNRFALFRIAAVRTWNSLIWKVCAVLTIST